VLRFQAVELTVCHPANDFSYRFQPAKIDTMFTDFAHLDTNFFVSP
jgi:hypothetical protein